MYQIKINGMPFSVPEGSTILEAARFAGIKIPTLCFLKDLNEIGACRVCVVEVKGARSLVAACVHPVNEGMEIFTNTPRVIESRKTTLQLLLSVHERKCLSCVRNGTCELQQLCAELGVDVEDKLDGERPASVPDTSTAHLVRNNAKCVLCRRCVAACEHQHVAVIGANNRGFDTQIGCAFNLPLAEVSCVSCGQCIVSCPTGALIERDQTAELLAAINDPEKYVVVQTAPSIRATLGECFDMPIGTNVKGKMVAALRRLGVDKVFDTDFGADLTIMEEAHEFIHRVKTGGVLPMITSCSPGWVKFCEHYFPDLLPNVSTCKSPQQMTGAMLKTWYAEKNGIDPAKDVNIEWKSENSECVAALNASENAIAMLPQPFVTTAQSKNSNLRVALDLTEEWDKLQENAESPSTLVTGVVVARTEFIEQNPQAVEDFLKHYQESVDYVNKNVNEGAALVGKYDIVTEAVAQKAIPECNITFISGNEMKEKLSGYLSVLNDQNAKSIGGKLPADDFYYNA